MKTMHTASQGSGVAGREALHLPPLHMTLSTIYAWSRILEAYRRRHPRHDVRVYYHGHVIHDLRLLVRQSAELDAKGFEVRVETHDGDSADVTRLLAMLEEAGGPEVRRFLTENNPDRWFGAAARS